MFKKKENINNNKQIFFKDLFSHIKQDNIAMLSSQTAFNFVVALVPFLVVAINLILFFASSEILTIQEYINKLPEELANIANELFYFIINQKSTSALSLGIIITIWSSSKGVKALINSLNKSFETEDNRGFIYNQLKSIIFTILLIIFIMVALGGVVFGDLILSWIVSFFKLELNNFSRSLIYFLKAIIPLILMISIFTSIYLFGPTFKQHKIPPFKPCFIGGVVSTIGCTIITYAYSFYINNFGNLSSVYGPLMGIMILFLWLNYTVLIIIFSGEVAATLLRLNYDIKK
ncbi:YihY/virulence factor BrkB family protein [Miniphocaeibacter massiliensis]|uniref:YihY/virulence factor BrkB family protein n=1 Tax=Miniphocaeibacter massiliensis TaxID=2041841 RepID=UPI000C1C7337|nr:YihY/virulence factor BrkB family protein [Miniphocaeibacter massiliensis]